MAYILVTLWPHLCGTAQTWHVDGSLDSTDRYYESVFAFKCTNADYFGLLVGLRVATLRVRVCVARATDLAAVAVRVTVFADVCVRVCDRVRVAGRVCVLLKEFTCDFVDDEVKFPLAVPVGDVDEALAIEPVGVGGTVGDTDGDRRVATLSAEVSVRPLTAASLVSQE